MSRLGRDKLRERGTSLGVDRSQAACLCEAFDLVKEIGQTCDRSATVRPACRTLNRRMVTAAEPVYSTCSSTNRRSNASATTYRNRPAPQPVYVLRAIGKWPELFDGLEAGRAANQSMAPFGRAIYPSRLVAMRTENFGVIGIISLSTHLYTLCEGETPGPKCPSALLES
jgi:hypothetical protein